jgi:multiple sugar transport system substrate-binding protein
VELHARQFEKLTGAKINIAFVPFNKLYQEALLGLNHNKYDVLFYGSMWIADVLPYLELISRMMLESAQYQDVLPYCKTVASRGDVPYQVPIDGDRHTLPYRSDILENPSYKDEFRKKTGKEMGEHPDRISQIILDVIRPKKNGRGRSSGRREKATPTSKPSSQAAIRRT